MILNNQLFFGLPFSLHVRLSNNDIRSGYYGVITEKEAEELRAATANGTPVIGMEALTCSDTELTVEEIENRPRTLISFFDFLWGIAPAHWKNNRIQILTAEELLAEQGVNEEVEDYILNNITVSHKKGNLALNYIKDRRNRTKLEDNYPWLLHNNCVSDMNRTTNYFRANLWPITYLMFPFMK